MADLAARLGLPVLIVLCLWVLMLMVMTRERAD